MYRNVTAWLIVLALVPTAIREAAAQDRLDLSGVEINAHGGVAFLDGLETNAPPRDREVEAAKAKARAAERFGKTVGAE